MGNCDTRVICHAPLLGGGDPDGPAEFLATIQATGPAGNFDVRLKTQYDRKDQVFGDPQDAKEAGADLADAMGWTVIED